MPRIHIVFATPRPAAASARRRRRHDPARPVRPARLTPNCCYRASRRGPARGHPLLAARTRPRRPGRRADAAVGRQADPVPRPTGPTDTPAHPRPHAETRHPEINDISQLLTLTLATPRLRADLRRDHTAPRPVCAVSDLRPSESSVVRPLGRVRGASPIGAHEPPASRHQDRGERQRRWTSRSRPRRNIARGLLHTVAFGCLAWALVIYGTHRTLSAPARHRPCRVDVRAPAARAPSAGFVDAAVEVAASRAGQAAALA